MEDDSIDLEDDLKMTASIWEMTVSIWKITVSIWKTTVSTWDILSLWCEALPHGHAVAAALKTAAHWWGRSVERETRQQGLGGLDPKP